MKLKILKEEKNDLEIELDNQTVAEILRVYLNLESDIEIAAWKKEHYSRPLILKLKTKTKNAKKVLLDAITRLEKDLSKYKDEFKKAK
jgi:DNA-directed RNA polymerase subunit L